MKAHPKEIKDKVLELLQKSRSYNEISQRTGILPATTEDWAADWRKEGKLTAFVREGAAHTQKAKLLSNGYYPSIRKRYHTMKRLDMLEKREFGFKSPVEAIPYFLKDGVPRPCAYCGAEPPEGKVWGLDRVNSKLAHEPYNLVPCCGTTSSGSQMSCQASKSKYPLREWLGMNVARTFGHSAEDHLAKRVWDIQQLAIDITMGIHKWAYCAHCENTMVVCGSCGNNCCNAGYGQIDGVECKDCHAAYELQELGWERNVYTSYRSLTNPVL